jgi:hypothetical protein
LETGSGLVNGLVWFGLVWFGLVWLILFCCQREPWIVGKLNIIYITTKLKTTVEEELSKQINIEIKMTRYPFFFLLND